MPKKLTNYLVKPPHHTTPTQIKKQRGVVVAVVLRDFSEEVAEALANSSLGTAAIAAAADMIQKTRSVRGFSNLNLARFSSTYSEIFVWGINLPIMVKADSLHKKYIRVI